MIEVLVLTGVLVGIGFLYRHSHTRPWVLRVASRLPFATSPETASDIEDVRRNTALLEEERYREEAAAHQEVIDRLDRELEPYRPKPPPCTSDEHEHVESFSWHSPLPVRRVCVPTALDTARARLEAVCREAGDVVDAMTVSSGGVVVDAASEKRFQDLMAEGKALRERIDLLEGRDAAQRMVARVYDDEMTIRLPYGQTVRRSA